MAKDRTWCTGPGWDPAAQDLFWARFKRAGKARKRAVYSKVSALWHTGDPAARQESLALVLRAQEKIPLDRIEAHVRLGLGELEPAEAYWRRQLAQAKPFLRNNSQQNLARVLARCSDQARRAESEARFERAHAAFLRDDFARFDVLVERLELPGASLEEAAESFEQIHYQRVKGLHDVDARLESAVFVGGRSSLVVLDEFLRWLDFRELVHELSQPFQPLQRWSRIYARDTYWPALGAYLGAVWVQAGGEWIERTPVGRSSVRYEGVELDVFRHAYRVVFFQRLTEELTPARVEPEEGYARALEAARAAVAAEEPPRATPRAPSGKRR